MVKLPLHSIPLASQTGSWHRSQLLTLRGWLFMTHGVKAAHCIADPESACSYLVCSILEAASSHRMCPASGMGKLSVLQEHGAHS